MGKILTGFSHEAAKPKRRLEDAAEDAPVQESMRGSRTMMSNPSTDQKRVRRNLVRKGSLDTQFDVEVPTGTDLWTVAAEIEQAPERLYGQKIAEVDDDSDDDDTDSDDESVDEDDADSKTASRFTSSVHVAFQEDFRSVLAHLNALNGYGVVVTYDSDGGMNHAVGTLSYDGHNVTVAGDHVVTIPVAEVLGVEATTGDEYPHKDFDIGPEGEGFNPFSTIFNGVFPSGGMASKTTTEDDFDKIIASNQRIQAAMKEHK